MKDLTAIDLELASGIALDSELGQPAIETSPGNSRAVIKVEHSLLVGDIPTRTSNEAAKVQFGNEMRGKYGFWECAAGKFCLGVKLIFVNYKQDYYTSISSTKPGIVSNKVRYKVTQL